MITRMFGAYSASLEGTANAANTYLAGDEEMAATIASGIAAADFDAASYLPPPSGTPGGGGGGGGR